MFLNVKRSSAYLDELLVSNGITNIALDWISFSLNALHSAGAEHIEWMLFDHTNVPQRLQSVCDLLWRLPKDEVPFAAVITVVSTPICVRQIRRTHFGL